MLGGGGDTVQMLLDGLAASGLFAPGLLEPHAGALARLRAARPWDVAALVPSHNDPNPRNLIYDGRRLWLVDWELARQNDPLFDLAIISTELADTPPLQTALLTAAFGRAPGEAQLAELAVVRLLARLFYGCIALEAFAHQPRAEPRNKPRGPDPGRVQRRRRRWTAERRGETRGDRLRLRPDVAARLPGRRRGAGL